jgi:hypothetical protein
MAMSCVVPGRMPVSIMYWTIVIGPNHIRCRGRSGLSAAFMYKALVPVGSALIWMVPQVQSGPMLHVGFCGCWMLTLGSRQTPRAQSMYSFQNRWVWLVML